MALRTFFRRTQVTTDRSRSENRIVLERRKCPGVETQRLRALRRLLGRAVGRASEDLTETWMITGQPQRVRGRSTELSAHHMQRPWGLGEPRQHRGWKGIGGPGTRLCREAWILFKCHVGHVEPIEGFMQESDVCFLKRSLSSVQSGLF